MFFEGGTDFQRPDIHTEPPKMANIRPRNEGGYWPLQADQCGWRDTANPYRTRKNMLLSLLSLTQYYTQA